jgi:hypothetical protein
MFNFFLLLFFDIKIIQELIREKEMGFFSDYLMKNNAILVLFFLFFFDFY